VRLQLKRISKSKYVTLGVLIDVEEGLPLMLTLELPWLANQRRISCIPEGVYWVEPYSSAKFPRCFEVCDVPGRDNILIHPGNTVNDVLGCICPGTNYGTLNEEPAVLQSRLALGVLKDYVGERSGFTLEIASG